MATGESDRVLNRSLTAMAGGEGQKDGSKLASTATLCGGGQTNLLLLLLLRSQWS